MQTCAPNTVRSKVTARVAEPHDGVLVRDLFTRCFEAPCEWLDWSNVSPHWLIAEVDGTPMGLMMMGLGKPWGWLECLMVDPSCSRQEKGRIVHALEGLAYTILRDYGAQGVVCSVSQCSPTFQRIVARREYVPIGHGATYLKRLA